MAEGAGVTNTNELPNRPWTSYDCITPQDTTIICLMEATVGALGTAAEALIWPIYTLPRKPLEDVFHLN